MALSRIVGSLVLALTEAVSRENLARTPEPSSPMNALAQIDAFDEAGTALMPVYHFNAQAIAALAPRGAHVVDLGSGSARFLSYLADCRPDLRITGIDLSPGMVEAGRATLAQRGQSERVKLVVGDMTQFRSGIDARIDLVSSVFALHHLPSHDDLSVCLEEIKGAVEADGARLWLFDFARPRRAATARRFPEVFTPEGPPVFKEDTCHSLKASWSFAELREALARRFPGQIHSSVARLLPLYQLHWLGDDHATRDPFLWNDTGRLSRPALRDAKHLQACSNGCLGTNGVDKQATHGWRPLAVSADW
jgi:ubiquinone/menaquinone biosynthesis C-methylase UbiE